MPHVDLARLARDLAQMRRHGPGGREKLRLLLGSIDPQLRRERNHEAVRLAQRRHQLRTADTRHDSAALQAAVEESAQRLAVLEQRVLEAIAAAKK